MTAPDPAPDVAEEYSPPLVLVLLVRLVWIAMWALLGASVGTFLTVPEAVVGSACLVGLVLLWKAARP